MSDPVQFLTAKLTKDAATEALVQHWDSFRSIYTGGEEDSVLGEGEDDYTLGELLDDLSRSIRAGTAATQKQRAIEAATEALVRHWDFMRRVYSGGEEGGALGDGEDDRRLGELLDDLMRAVEVTVGARTLDLPPHAE